MCGGGGGGDMPLTSVLGKFLTLGRLGGGGRPSCSTLFSVNFLRLGGGKMEGGGV